MANYKHSKILDQGTNYWNHWRKENPQIEPDLRGARRNEADLSGANFNRADLRDSYLIKANLSGSLLNEANLSGSLLIEANLSWSELRGADLSRAEMNGANLLFAKLRGARLIEANLVGANLIEAELVEATLRDANLCQTYLYQADFSGADLSSSYLERAQLVGTNFEGANLSNSRIYGISAWNLIINQETKQLGLVITQVEPVITVDNLEVAQFVYLLLNNEKIRDVINTIGKKGVLILGRFTKERKVVLNKIREKLRKLDFMPMMFDFERSRQRDFTETIKTLAGMSRFIIADITNPKSAPLELQATMPDYMIPFVPIIQEGEEPFSMFRDLKKKYGEWVLDVLEYDSAERLIDVMADAIVQPALKKAEELIELKAEALKKRHVRDYKRKS